jgi:phosphoesterase RecJ-like protein
MEIRNGVVVSFLTKKDLQVCGAESEDASGIVNLINCLPESKIAMLFLEMSDGTIKASLRTEKDKIDVSRLARLFGGGGHKKAAGFSLRGKLVRSGKGWKIENI